MTRVARDLYRIVLNHVLLDDGVARSQARSLLDSLRVETSLGNEAIITWNMRCRFRCSDGQLMVLIALRLRLCWQFISRVVAVGAN